jgi:hypothetical protein
MAHSDQGPAYLARAFFSEAGFMSAFAMRAARAPFQRPFELREIVHQPFEISAVSTEPDCQAVAEKPQFELQFDQITSDSWDEFLPGLSPLRNPV